MLRAIRIYLSLILIGNPTWETLQLPFYTIWQMGTPRQQAFAAIHCTAGDFLIATTTLVLALVTVGYRDWPMSHFKRVAAIASALGLGYAIFSEWLNISVRGTWSYLALMPVVICWVESGLIAAAPMEHCPDSVLRRDATLHTTAAQ